MFKKIINTFNWFPSYFSGRINTNPTPLKHLFFAICDHYEPYWRNANRSIARNRITKWIKSYPPVAEKYKDSDGRNFVYSFFYPEEEYLYDDMEQLAEICRAGFGEVEIHLHHDNDTSDNLRKTLLDFKKRLANEHGLLSRNKLSKEISYAFIHGNWALDNSRPDGRMCGVNDEITVLQETGCFADMTMPSAPDVTQTKKINSIYYAIDNPLMPKSHDNGQDSVVGKKQDGLLNVQGPLTLNFRARSGYIFPKIENGGLISTNPPSIERFKHWINCRIHVKGLPDWGFVKIYTHGAQEKNMEMLFDDGYFEEMLGDMVQWSIKNDCKIHFVSAREMVNIIIAIENGATNYDISLKDSTFVKSNDFHP